MERELPGRGLGRPDTRLGQVLSMGRRICARAVRGAWRKGLGRHREPPAERGRTVSWGGERGQRV